MEIIAYGFYELYIMAGPYDHLSGFIFSTFLYDIENLRVSLIPRQSGQKVHALAQCTVSRPFTTWGTHLC